MSLRGKKNSSDTAGNHSAPEVSSEGLFIDRDIPRSEFFKGCLLLKNDRENSSRRAIAWAGVGGIGKTALLNFLKSTFESQTSPYSGLKYVEYDFNAGRDSTDTVVALKNLRNALTKKYDADFPLFDKGLLRYREKIGEYITKEEIEEVLKGSRTFRKIKAQINSAADRVDTLGNIGSIVSGLIDFTEQISETSTALKITKGAVKFFDAVIAKRAEEAKKNNDSEFAEIQREFTARENATESYKLMEYLPRLFAKDLADWLEETDSKLVIFLDHYEKLTEDERDAKRQVQLLSLGGRNVNADWWIKDEIDDNFLGIMNVVPRVLWIFAGRNKLTFEKDFWDSDDYFQQFQLDAFSPKYSKEFLEKVGITEPEIVAKVTQLTGGSPLWLNLCQEIYSRFKNAGKIPEIDDFGGKREEIVLRLMKTMHADAKNMTQALCILGMWTDETAARLVPNYNAETYRQVKNFSFTKTQDVKADGKNLKIFSMDRMTRTVLLPYISDSSEHRVILKDIAVAADKYFGEFFDELPKPAKNRNARKYFSSETKAYHYFGFWAEIIIVTAFESKELMVRYEENLAKYADSFDIALRESIAESFVDKIKTLGADFNSAPYAYFEHRAGAVKFARENYNNALKFEESAYGKFKRLNLDDTELKYKIAVMKGLADVYRELKYQKKEIELCEEILRTSRKIFRPANNENIIDAMKKLADTLDLSEHAKDSAKIYKQIFELVKNCGDEEKIADTEYDYARSLNGIGENEEALKLLEDVKNRYEILGDENKVIETLREVTYLLGEGLFWRRSHLGGKKYAEQKLERQRELLALLKRNCTDKFDAKIMRVIYDIADTLEELGEKNDARMEREIFASELKAHIEKSGKTDEDTADKIDTLITLLERMDDSERCVWEEKFKNLRREIVKEKTTAPVADVSDAINAIKNLIKSLSSDIVLEYREKITLHRKIIALAEENNFDEKDVIKYKKNFTRDLTSRSEGWNEGLSLREEIAEKTKTLYGLTSEEYIDALNDIVGLLDDMGDKTAVFEKRKEIYQILADNDAEDKQILSAMKAIALAADRWGGTQNFTEVKNWREKILEFCEEKFVEDGPEVVEALEDLIEILDYLQLDASEYSERLDAIKSENLGEEHSDSIYVKEQLADKLHDRGKYDDELELRLQIVELYEKNAEKNSYFDSFDSIVYAIKTTAELYDDLGRKKEAHEMRQKIIDLQLENRQKTAEKYGEDSPEVIEALDDLDSSYRQINNFSSALKMLEEILKIAERIYSPGSNRILRAQRNLARFYDWDLGDDEKADEIRLAAVQTQKKLLQEKMSESDEDDSEIIEIRKKLANNLSELYFDDEALENQQEILNTRRRIAKNLEANFGETNDDVIDALENMDSMSMSYIGFNDYRLCLEIRRRLSDIYRKKYVGAEDDYNVINAMDNEAEILQDLKRFPEVLKIRREIFNLQRQKPFGETSDETFTALREIADFYSDRRGMEDYAAALKVFDEEIFPLLKAKYSDDETQDDFINMLELKAEVLIEVENFEDAFEIYRHISELNRQKYKNDTHDDVIRAMKNYARILTSEKYCSRALEVRKNIVNLLTEKYDGEFTDELGDAKKDVVELYEVMNNFEAACDLREEICRDFENKFGGENPKTVETLEECAETFELAEKYDEAVNYRQRVADIFGKNPADSEDGFGAVIALADVLEKAGREDDALRERGRIVDEIENLVNQTVEIYGENSLETLEILNTYARNLNDIERDEDELKVSERIKNICENLYGKTSKKYIDAAEDVARCFDNCGKNDEALKILKEIAELRQAALNARISLFGKTHRRTIEARENLASSLEAIGKNAEAEKLNEENLTALKEIAEIRQEKFGKSAPSTLEALNKYARSLVSGGEYDDALKIHGEIVAALKEKFSDEKDAWEIIEALREYAKILNRAEKYANEEKIRREILSLCEKKFSFNPGYSETTNSLESLAKVLQQLGKFDEAEKFYRDRINRLTEKYLGNALHMEIIEVRENLAENFEQAEKYSAAVEERQKILEDLKKIFAERLDAHNFIECAEKNLHHAENLRDGISDEFDEEEDLPNEKFSDEPEENFDDFSALLKNIDTSASVNLRKGQKIDLTKNNPNLKNLMLCFEWNNSDESEIEIDGSACVLYSGDKVKRDEDFIFYNNPLHESGCANYVKIGDGNDALLKISLEKIPEDAEKIAFTLSIYEGNERGQNFGQVCGAMIRIIDSDTEKELARFAFDDNFYSETGVVVGTIYRHKGEFKFNAICAGFDGGLVALCNNFGVSVE